MQNSFQHGIRIGIEIERFDFTIFNIRAKYSISESSLECIVKAKWKEESMKRVAKLAKNEHFGEQIDSLPMKWCIDCCADSKNSS